jgi:hypothetical protein
LLSEEGVAPQAATSLSIASAKLQTRREREVEQVCSFFCQLAETQRQTRGDAERSSQHDALFHPGKCPPRLVVGAAAPPQRPAQAGPSRGLRRPSCPAATDALTPSPSPALFQARLEAYKAAKDTQTAEELKAALDAKMAKATAKHEDILKMKVEA